MDQNQLHIKSYIKQVLVYWPFYVLAMIIAWISSYMLIRYSTPVYTVNSLIVLKEASGSNILAETKLFKENKQMANEIAIITSYDMIYKTLENLDFGVSYYHVGQVKNTELYGLIPFKVVLDS